MKVEILPQNKFDQEQAISAPVITLPPDKSIFHRILLIGAMTKSRITIPISSIEEIPADVYATILALESLGVDIDISQRKIEFEGVGGKFRKPSHTINCANSGTTARLLMGLLSGTDFSTVLSGDKSLSRRPMQRVAELLSPFGAIIETNPIGSMPVIIDPGRLRRANIHLQIPSAQMKSAAILAALQAKGTSQISESKRSRNHTELMLEAFGKGITSMARVTTINDYAFTLPKEITYNIPGDPSSAAYLIAAAMILRKNITLKNMSMNPTRIKYFRRLKESDVIFKKKNQKKEWLEPRADLEVAASEIRSIEPFVYLEEQTPAVIDEIPFLAVLAAYSRGDSVFFGAGELRKKESDRLISIVENLTQFGAEAEARNDHLVVFGNTVPSGGIVQHHNDHRIAMAMAIFALKAKEPVIIPDAEIVAVSYPNFYQDLASIIGKERIKIS